MATTQLSLGIEVEPTPVTVRDLILREPIAQTSRRKSATPTEPWRYDVAVSSGADVAVRRERGDKAEMLVTLVSQNQFYLKNERTGHVKALTPSAMLSFMCDWDATWPFPWLPVERSPRPVTVERALAMLGDEGVRDLAKRDLVVLGDWRGRANPRDVKRAAGALLGARCGRCALRAVEGMFEHDVAKAVVSVAVGALHGAPYTMGDRAYAAAANLRHVDELDRVESVRPDHVRAALAAGVDLWAGGFVEGLARVLAEFDAHGVRADPTKAIRHAESLVRERGERALLDWYRCVYVQSQVRGSVEDRWPSDPRSMLRTLDREMESARHLARAADFALRAHELARYEWDDGTFRVMAPQRPEDLVEESNLMHNCVRGYIDRHARGDTSVLLMRRSAAPEVPLVTVEVRDGSVRQAFQSHNRVIDAEQRDFLERWGERVGVEVPSQLCRAYG